MVGASNVEHWEEGGIHSYRFLRREIPFAERVEPREDDEVYYDEKLYLRLIWRLASGRRVYMVPRYWREAGFVEAGEPFALVRWEYEVEDQTDDAGAIRGFLPARSSVRLSPPPGPWEREHGHLAGLFEAPKLDFLEKTFRGLLGDATAAMNVYVLEDVGRAEQVAQVLMDSTPPTVEMLLGPRDFMAHLGIGVDWAFAVLVVHSRVDIERDLTEAFAGELRAKN